MLRRAMKISSGRGSIPTSFRILVAGMLLAALAPRAEAQKAPPAAGAGDKAQPKVNEGEEFEPEETRGGPPPSKMLERAKKLYDRGDYYSATIELDKVIKGTEDS